METILPFITAIVAAFLGLLASAYLNYIQHRHDITIKIIEQYFSAREQLCDKLSDLANLQIASDCTVDHTMLAEYRKDLYKLFYKYYDFLPREVLKEMLCLHACLSDKENRLYKCENDCLLLLEGQDLREFVERIALIDNFKYYASIPLKSKDADVRRIASVNYQARGVLSAINRHFTIQHLTSWHKYLRKSGSTKPGAHGTLLYNDVTHLSLTDQAVIPRDTYDIEEQLAIIIASILGVVKVEPDDNFYDLGMNSLLAIKIMSHVKSELGIELPLLAIFEASTLRELIMKIMQDIPAQP